MLSEGYDKRKLAMAGKVVRALGDNLAGKTIGVLGLTYKPNTDDMRAAPSLDIIPALQAKGARIQAFDPQDREARRTLRDLDFKQNPCEAAEGADCLLILTEWDQFRALDLERVKELMRSPIVVDLRNIYRPEDMRAHGFRYVCVGRKSGTIPNERSRPYRESAIARRRSAKRALPKCTG